MGSDNGQVTVEAHWDKMGVTEQGDNGKGQDAATEGCQKIGGDTGR